MPDTDRKVIAAIIPAAGSGSRMGTDVPKQFLELSGMPILVQTVTRFFQVVEISYLVIALPSDHRSLTAEPSETDEASAPLTFSARNQSPVLHNDLSD